MKQTPISARFTQQLIKVNDQVCFSALQVPVIFWIARACEADHTAAAVGKRYAADHCMPVCFSMPTRRLTVRLHAKETTSMTIDVATGMGVTPDQLLRSALPAGRESRKAELRPESVEMEVRSVLKIVGVV
jgi:hypothetical protein